MKKRHTTAQSLGCCAMNLETVMAAAIANRAIEQFEFYRATETTPGLVLADDDILVEFQMMSEAGGALITTGLHTVVKNTIVSFSRMLTQRLPNGNELDSLIRQKFNLSRQVTAGQGYKHLSSEPIEYLTIDPTSVPNLALRQALVNITVAVMFELNWNRTPDGDEIENRVTNGLMRGFYANEAGVDALRGLRAWTTNPNLRVETPVEMAQESRTASATRPLTPTGIG